VILQACGLVRATSAEPLEALAAKVRAREIAFAKTDFGTLALSSGPVFGPDGKRTGTYNPTWRLEKDGEWRVVPDSGCPPCSCP
jgi:hypothetical protein